MSLKTVMPGTLSRTARVCAGITFTALGLSFVATTVALFVEFQDADWFTIATLYSHLFLFFPSFGLLALCAFAVPATVFADLYMRHVPYGRLRFLLGFPALVALSVWIAGQFLKTDVPAIWWLSPQTLAADKGDPRGCGIAPSPACRRVPILESIKAVRDVSQKRMGLSPFVRDCQPDRNLEAPPEQMHKRLCFISKSMTTAPECCQQQVEFTDAIRGLYRAEPEHSLTGWVHAVTLPFKVFFLLFVLILGVLLALWRRTIDRLYEPFTQRIERGVLIGAVAMLLWPISNHAFLQSASVLYGKFGEGVYGTLSPILSAAFGIWALLLLLFFYRRHERDLESAAKIGGALASAIAVLKYNEIIDYAVRFVGSGSDPIEMIAMAGLLIVAFVLLARSVLTREHAAPADAPVSDEGVRS